MSRISRIAFATAVTVAVALPAAAAGGTAHSATTKTVTIKDIDFNPPVLTIHRGDVVRWTWRDAPTPHDVTSRGPLRFRSSTTKTSGTWSVRFRRPGTYRYVCTVHFNMKGRIVVR